MFLLKNKYNVKRWILSHLRNVENWLFESQVYVRTETIEEVFGQSEVKHYKIHL